MVTTAFCVRGYCSTGSELIARKPSARIIRLTTVARTGRRMKRSVRRMGRASFFRDLRIGAEGNADLVVDLDRRTVVELVLPRAHHDSAGLDSGQDRDLVTSRVAGLHEHLLGDILLLSTRLSTLLSLLLDDVRD